MLADKMRMVSGGPSEIEYILATDMDFSGTGDGSFEYIGSDLFVEIPHVIQGYPVTSYAFMFMGTGVRGVKSTNTNVTDTTYMFANMVTPYLDVSELNTSNVTNMDGMFRDNKATDINLSNFNTSSATNMQSMFERSEAIKLDLSSFDTSKVTSMDKMFLRAKAQEIDLSSFNTGNVTTMQSMFEASLVKSLDISHFNTSKVTTMHTMFKALKVPTLDLSSFNTSNVTSMESMFELSNIQYLDLSNLNTSKVTTMKHMFYSSKLGQILDLGSFDTSNVTTMHRMFRDTSFEDIILTSFNTDKLTDMSEMFNGSRTKHLDLSSFTANEQTSLGVRNMFTSSRATTIDLRNLDLSRLPNTANSMFYNATELETLYVYSQFEADLFLDFGNLDPSVNIIIAGNVGPLNLPPVLHLNGPEYGVGDYTAATTYFSNTNIGIHGSDYTYESQESLNYLASRGWEYVKVPIRWERIQQSINGILRASEAARLDGFMDRCQTAGLKVIIDIHNYGLYYRNVGGVGTRTQIGHTQLPISAFADLWSRLATRYKDHPATFGYAIMAEPQSQGGLTSEVWKQASQAAVDAIRLVDTKTEIHVAGFEWSSLQYWEWHNGPDAWITDNTNGIIRYEAHHYFDADNSGGYHQTYAQDLAHAQATHSAGVNLDALHTKTLEELRTYNTWLTNNDVLGIIGEFGWIKDDLDWEALGVRYIEEANSMEIPLVPWCSGEWTDGDNLGIYGITNYRIAYPFSQGIVWEDELLNWV